MYLRFRTLVRCGERNVHLNYSSRFSTGFGREFFLVSIDTFARALRMLVVTMKRTVFARPIGLGIVALGFAFGVWGCGGDHLHRNDGIALFGDPIELVRDESRTARVATHLVPGEPATVSSFSVTDLPDGVTGQFDQPTLNFATTPAADLHLTLSASRTAQTGLFTATVKRTKGGTNEFYTDAFKIKVIDFAVDVDSDDTSVSLSPGSSHDTKITIHRRGNSSGTVEFDLGGSLPDGVSYDFNPDRVLVDADHPNPHTTLTLTADSSASSSSSDTCHVRALKGVNVDNSQDISVSLTVPDPPPDEKPNKLKKG